MKTFTLLALATGLSAPIAAQNLNPPVFNWRLVNAVANPGFEDRRFAPWIQAGQTSPVDVPTALNPTLAGALGYLRGGGHSGNVCYAFGVGYDDFAKPNDHYGVLRQDLATPLAGSSVWSASAWFYSVGQNVLLRINYTDGTFGTAYKGFASVTPDPNDNGWRLWDFKSAIDSNKTVASLEFSVLTNYGHPWDVLIDDVSLTRWVYAG